LKVFNSISEFAPNTPTIVTLGTFDGVHIGHKKIIERLIGSAAASECESLVLTFFPHPRMVLQDQSEIKLLNTINERSQLLEKTGLDNLVIHPFNKEFSRLTAEEFVKDILVDSFNLKKIIIGYDHRFGRNRTANIDDLIRYGEIYGFEVEQISSQEINDVSVSSTKIRNALIEGEIELANTFLGYPYFLTGKVVRGKQIGRTIGYPTANIDVCESYKLIPKQGIYVVSSVIDDAIVYGMMSIGTNPTVGGTEQTIEVYYFDFDRDIYGLEIQVSILHRLRDEETFDSLEALKSKLEEDQRLSFEFLSGRL
jgi:riboflavin kinase/FMN adenylyltransferase